MNELITEILKLKKEKDAVILVHNYQLPEIQDIADFIGDSLELSKIASNVEKPVIVFCGVRFMAETAKILSPKKDVLLPALTAGCPLADMIDSNSLALLKEKHPNASIVCYVNSSVEIKAMSDVCCTSANALKVVESIDSNEVIFVPDKGLGSYVAEKTNKKVILYEGYCPTHFKITKEDVLKAKNLHPDAIIMIHPECPKEARDISDFVLGTGEMLKLARESKYNKFLIGTEEGMIYRLKKEVPNKEFYLINSKLYCPNMKKTNLQLLYESLSEFKYAIELPNNILEKARFPLLRMFEIESTRV